MLARLLKLTAAVTLLLVITVSPVPEDVEARSLHALEPGVLSPPAAAFADCEDCITPTICGPVEESEVEDCWPHFPQGGGEPTCEFRTGSGCSPTVQLLLSPPHREDTLDFNGIEYRGEFVADVNGLAMNVIGVDDGLFVRWNCGEDSRASSAVTNWANGWPLNRIFTLNASR